MTKRLQKMGLVLAMALLLFTYIPLFSVSAESGAIGITPAFPIKGNDRSKGIFIHTLKGGESVEDGVQIFNYTKQNRTIVLDAVDSASSTDGSFSCKQNSEKKTDVGNWITLDSKQITVAAESNEIVKFTIKVPAGTSPGEHDACITAQDTEDFATKEGGSGILLGFRNAIRMAITVPGKIVKELTITKIDIKKVKDDYVITPVSRNTGNVSLDVDARAQLVGFFGDKTKIQSARYPILPGATTGWGFTFKRPFWGGFYKAKTLAGYNANPADGLGQNTDKQTKIRKESGYVFLMPAPQALAVELAVPAVLLFGIFIALRRRYRRKTAHKRMLEYVVQPGDTIMSVAKEHGMKWRKLAHLNGLKAPYALSEGKTLFVPKKKAAKAKAEAPSDWLHEEEPSEGKSAPTQSVATQKPARVVPANDWQAPVAPTPTPYEDTRFPEPSYAPMQGYEEEVDIPDWREGASKEELAKLGVLHDSSAVPKLSSSWNIDEDAKPPASKKATAHKKKPVAKKTAAKHKKGS